MNFVEPIRNRRKISQIKNLLRGEKRYRDLLLFTVGINTALRVSDLLALRVGQLVDADGTPSERFWIREEKRGKRNEITINDSIIEALDLYLAAYPQIVADPANALFWTPRGDPRTPIVRSRAWQMIAELCDAVGLRGNYGTHTLRKTWGYHARLSGVPLELIMARLNHKSFDYTKRYLGITDDELADVARRLNL